MGSTTDKIKGMANTAAGKMRQGVGKAVGSEKMQAKGKVQELKGVGQEAKGQAKSAVTDTANKAANTINKKR